MGNTDDMGVSDLGSITSFVIVSQFPTNQNHRCACLRHRIWDKLLISPIDAYSCFLSIFVIEVVSLLLFSSSHLHYGKHISITVFELFNFPYHINLFRLCAV